MSVNASSAAFSLQDGRYGNPYVLLIGAVLATAIFVRWYTTNSDTDIREPPVLHPKFPIIGHLLGFMKLQADYFQNLWYVPRCPHTYLKPVTERTTQCKNSITNVYNQDLLYKDLRNHISRARPSRLPKSQDFVIRTNHRRGFQASLPND